MVEFFANMPLLLRLCFVGGGWLVSALAGRFPEWAQDAGLILGLVILAFGAVSTLWYGVNFIRAKRGEPKIMVEPIHIIALGLAIAAMGVGWQFLRSPPAQTLSAAEQKPTQTLSIASDHVVLSQPPTFLNTSRFYSQAEKEQLANSMNRIEQLLNSDGARMAHEAGEIASRSGSVNWEQLETLIQRMNAISERANSLNSELDNFRNSDRLGLASLLAEKPVYFEPFKNAVSEMANTMLVYRHLAPNAGEYGAQLGQTLESQKRNLLRAKFRFEEWVQKCDRLISGTRIALKKQ